LTSYELYRQNTPFQLSSIRHVLGTRSLFHRPKLHKGIVAFHVNSDKFPKRFKEHLEIFSLGCFFMKVYDKESFRGLNILATVIFLAFDSSISSRKLCTKRRRDVCNFPEQEIVKEKNRKEVVVGTAIALKRGRRRGMVRKAIKFRSMEMKVMIYALEDNE
jgi:hypothetical protein